MGALGKPKQGDLRGRICAVCAGSFSYVIRRGSDRRYCSDACRVVSRQRLREQKVLNAPTCLTAGCGKKSNPDYKNGLCIACYCYAWRTGKARDPRKKPYKLKTVKRSDGKSYRVLKVPGHPLAMSGGNVYHHRLVAYSARNGVCGPCYWCAAPLQWKQAIVDHLDEDGKNNEPSNLVVTCNKCNRARGAMLPFFRRLVYQRADELVALMLKQVSRVDGAA